MARKSMENFYDKTAKKFGGYAFGKNKPRYVSEYQEGNPEEIFKKKLIKVSGKEKIALDIGCGDGKFIFEIAKYFLKIVGIDTSKELLKIAEKRQKELKIDNVYFEFQDAKKTAFDDESFDVLYCRRGPRQYTEYYRIVKEGGYYLEICIGEKDIAELKKVFGRGQDFGGWDKSRLPKDSEEFKNSGFRIMFAKDFNYIEYYHTYNDLEMFLGRVPIFEDFDPENDKRYLEDYVKKFQTEKGIKLQRHRIVYVAQK